MKHKIIGLFVVYAMYSSLGLFGIYLRAAESSPPARLRPVVPPLPPARLRLPPPAPLPVYPIPQPAFGQFGNLPVQIPQPAPSGQFTGQAPTSRVQDFGQFGKFGGGSQQFGGIGKFGGFGQQTDLYGKRVTGI